MRKVFGTADSDCPKTPLQTRAAACGERGEQMKQERSQPPNSSVGLLHKLTGLVLYGGARMMRFWSVAAALALAAGQLLGQCGSPTGQPLDFTPRGDFGTIRQSEWSWSFSPQGRQTALHVLTGFGRGQHSGFPHRHRAGRAWLDSGRGRHAVRASAGGSGGEHSIHHASGSDRLHGHKRHASSNAALFADRLQYSMDAVAGVQRADIFHSAHRYWRHAAL